MSQIIKVDNSLIQSIDPILYDVREQYKEAFQDTAKKNAFQERFSLLNNKTFQLKEEIDKVFQEHYQDKDSTFFQDVVCRYKKAEEIQKSIETIKKEKNICVFKGEKPAWYQKVFSWMTAYLGWLGVRKIELLRLDNDSFSKSQLQVLSGKIQERFFEHLKNIVPIAKLQGYPQVHSPRPIYGVQVAKEPGKEPGRLKIFQISHADDGRQLIAETFVDVTSNGLKGQDSIIDLTWTDVLARLRDTHFLLERSKDIVEVRKEVQKELQDHMATEEESVFLKGKGYQFWSICQRGDRYEFHDTDDRVKMVHIDLDGWISYEDQRGRKESKDSIFNLFQVSRGNSVHEARKKEHAATQTFLKNAIKKDEFDMYIRNNPLENSAFLVQVDGFFQIERYATKWLEPIQIERGNDGYLRAHDTQKLFVIESLEGFSVQPPLSQEEKEILQRQALEVSLMKIVSEKSEEDFVQLPARFKDQAKGLFALVSRSQQSTWHIFGRNEVGYSMIYIGEDLKVHTARLELQPKGFLFIENNRRQHFETVEEMQKAYSLKPLDETLKTLKPVSEEAPAPVESVQPHREPVVPTTEEPEELFYDAEENVAPQDPAPSEPLQPQPAPKPKRKRKRQ